MKRSLLLAACLLAAAPAVATGLFGGPPEPGKMPSRFIRFELASIGPGPGYIMIRALKASCVLGQFRFGLAALDNAGLTEEDLWWITATPFDDMLVPVHVGYTLWSRPVRSPLPASVRTYGVVPDVYVEASGSLLSSDARFRPTARAALCCEIDYSGVGAGAEAGFMTEPRGQYPSGRLGSFFVALRLRLLAFSVGF